MLTIIELKFPGTWDENLIKQQRVRPHNDEN